MYICIYILILNILDLSRTHTVYNPFCIFLIIYDRLSPVSDKLPSDVWRALGLNKVGIGTFGSFTSGGFGVIGSDILHNVVRIANLRKCIQKWNDAVHTFRCEVAVVEYKMVRNGGNKHFYHIRKSCDPCATSWAYSLKMDWWCP